MAGWNRRQPEPAATDSELDLEAFFAIFKSPVTLEIPDDPTDELPLLEEDKSPYEHVSDLVDLLSAFDISRDIRHLSRAAVDDAPPSFGKMEALANEVLIEDFFRAGGIFNYDEPRVD